MTLGNKEIMAKNIRYYMDKKGIDRQTLVADLGLKYMTVSDWINAKTYPRIDKIELMANYFGIKKSDLVEEYKPHGLNSDKILLNSNYDKLNTDNQVKLVDYSSNLIQKQNAEHTVADNTIRLFSYDYYDQALSAGTGQYLNDVRVEQIELPIDIDADFVVPVYGNSMEPEYYTGDYVFVELSVELSNGDIGVFDYYGDAYIKELLINENGAFLHSLNPEYKDIPIDADSDFRIIGKVVGKYRLE